MTSIKNKNYFFTCKLRRTRMYKNTLLLKKKNPKKYFYYIRFTFNTTRKIKNRIQIKETKCCLWTWIITLYKKTGNKCEQ